MSEQTGPSSNTSDLPLDVRRDLQRLHVSQHAQDAPLLTLTGVVREGVEVGSVVLQTAHGTYQIGAAGADYCDQRVTVRGRPRPDLLSLAMQGVVIDVESVSLQEGP